MEEDENYEGSSKNKRNGIAFWILGLCNNFAYVVMLSAAKDILDKDSIHLEKPCRESVNTRDCHLMSTGSVLLADILPALIVKVTAPIFIHRIPFGLRHLVVVVLQAASFITVAASETSQLAIFGVVLASFGSGLGEITYLALTSNYSSRVVSFWSSGTGGAGIVGALAYAFLTEPRFLSFTPKHAMYLMLITPILFTYTYWGILHIPRNVQRVDLFKPSTYWIRPAELVEAESETSVTSGLLDEEREGEVRNEPVEIEIVSRNWFITKLLRFMIPLVLVYFAEYYINQGLLELLEFDCSNGFSLSADSQYRWFQVTYQLGVFISRSSSDCFSISAKILPLLAVLQIANGILFTAAVIFYFIPHISIAFLLILFEGLLGGSSYVNTFRAVHDQIPVEKREFSMAFVSISDTVGIVMAGFLAINVHNYICSLKL